MASGKRMFSVSFTGNDKIVRNARMLREKFPEWLSAANQETANEIFDLARKNIKAHDAYTSGELYDSIVVEVTARGLAIYVGSTSKHAPFVEFGTRPHFPPLAPIRQWCLARGLPESAAFPIARAISERGTPERPFLWPAAQQGKRNHLARMRDLVRAGMRGLLG